MRRRMWYPYPPFKNKYRRRRNLRKYLKIDGSISLTINPERAKRGVEGLIKLIFLILVVVFFAMNMGASGIAPTFSAVYGARLLKKKAAAILFTLFVILGALTLGRGVVKTLSQGILPKGFLTPEVAMIILVSATLSLFLANLLAIPESTSMVTVGAVVGAGLYFKHLQLKTFCWLIPMWIVLPLISFALTFFLY